MSNQQQQPAPVISDYAQLIGNAKPSEGGIYFLEGQYLLWVDKIQPKTSRDQDKLVIADFDILESTNELRAAGSSVGEVFNLTKAKVKDVHPGKVKLLIAAVMGKESDKELTAEEIGETLSPGNPRYGRLVRAVTTIPDPKKTDDSGNPFVRTRYEAIPEAQQALAKEARLAAGFPAF